MAGFRSFEDLDAWKRGYELTREVYRLTSEGDIARDFCLRDRLRKASVSVIASIAQGYEQQAEAGFLPFLAQARGAIAEVKALLNLARDLEYLGDDDFNRAREAAEAASKMTGGFYHYLRKNPGKNGDKPKPDGWPVSRPDKGKAAKEAASAEG